MISRCIIALVALTALGVFYTSPLQSKTKGERVIVFETDQGTWMNLDVSPDGSQIVFDLLGDIYLLPARGGKAKPLTSGRDWDHQPRFSPDGKSIAFVSDRDGMPNLWRMNPDGRGVSQISTQYSKRVSSPSWCGGSSKLVARLQTAGGREELWMFDMAGSSEIRLRGTDKFSKPAGPDCSIDGRYVYFSARVPGEYSFYHEDFQRSEQLLRLDLDTGLTAEITTGRDGGMRPRFSHNGRLLAYAKSRGDITSLWLRDIETGRDRLLVSGITPNVAAETRHLDTLPAFAFTPNDNAIVISMQGKIFQVSVKDGTRKLIPFTASVRQRLAPLLQVPRKLTDKVDTRIIRWPTVSPDGSKLVFSALAKLWIMDLPGGKPRRLTDSNIAEYAPAFSPDGKWLVYSTWSDSEAGGHLILARADGTMARPLTKVVGQYLNPSWSADGSKIVFLRGNKGAEQLYQDHGGARYRAHIVWMDFRSGESVSIGRPRSPYAGVIDYPTPTFNGKGDRIYYVEDEDDKRVLVSARLDGRDLRHHLRFPPGETALVSPDDTRVAIIRGHKIYVIPLTENESETPYIDLDQYPDIPSEVQRINSDRADFPSWHDKNTLIWASGRNVYRQRLSSASRKNHISPKLFAEAALKFPRANPGGVFAITNARLITMKGKEFIEKGTIVVQGNRIRDVGEVDDVAIPRGAKIINAAGKTIIPGLIDTHAHMHIRVFGTYPQQKWSHVAALAYGVTSTYDPASRSVEIFEIRDMVDIGIMLGPRIFSSGTILGGYSAKNNSWFSEVTSLEDAHDVLRGHKIHGTDMLKEYMHPRRDQRQYLIQAARQMDMVVTGEIGSNHMRLLTEVLDGYTAFEHSMPIAPIYRDVIELIARSKTFHTPTFSTANNPPGMLDYFAARRDHASDKKLRRFLPSERTYDYERWKVIPDDEWYFIKQAAAANQISTAGGKVSMGSHNQYHGIAAHWELWVRALAGGDPYRILRDATLRGAQKLGLEKDLGSIESGKFADFLVLSANPLEDIYNTEKIEKVVKDGFIYDADSMTRLWPNRKPLSQFFWQIDQK